MYKLKDFGANLADKVANFVGSWKFIIWQTIILLIWMIVNVEQVVHFDPYPFILMNLLLSSQAAYATPMILMSANRQAERDRKQVLEDLAVDVDTNAMIKALHDLVVKLDEDLKLDRQALKEHAEILAELKKLKSSKK